MLNVASAPVERVPSQGSGYLQRKQRSQGKDLNIPKWTAETIIVVVVTLAASSSALLCYHFSNTFSSLNFINSRVLFYKIFSFFARWWRIRRACSAKPATWRCWFPSRYMRDLSLLHDDPCVVSPLCIICVSAWPSGLCIICQCLCIILQCRE